MLKNPIWNTIETTQFYYSDYSTTGHPWLSALHNWLKLVDWQFGQYIRFLCQTSQEANVLHTTKY